MNKNDLAIKTKKRVEEVSTKIKDLKIKISQDTNSEIEEGMQAAIDRLDKLNQEIREQYRQFVTSPEKSETQVSEMEKNIYNSIESFNDAFTSAGSLFKRY